MAKIILTTVTNSQDISNINANFSTLAAALNLNVLYRKNIAGEDNTMQNDLDFNGYRAYNLADVLVNGISVTTVATNAQNAANSASASAGAALASQVASASSQAAAAQSAIDAANAAGASGSLIAVNNLSDVPNKITARLNLGLDQVNNTSDAAKPVSTATQTALNLKTDLTFAASTYATISNLALKAPLASPALTGTATLVNATYSGLITPASVIGIKGTVAADNAQAGSIGEYIEVQGVAQTPVSGTPISVSTINLSAGDWDVETQFTVAGTGATLTLLVGGNSLVLNARGAAKSETVIQMSTTLSQVFATPTLRVNVSAGNTPVYPTALITFTGSGVSVTSVVRARRIR